MLAAQCILLLLLGLASTPCSCADLTSCTGHLKQHRYLAAFTCLQTRHTTQAIVLRAELLLLLGRYREASSAVSGKAHTVAIRIANTQKAAQSATQHRRQGNCTLASQHSSVVLTHSKRCFRCWVDAATDYLCPGWFALAKQAAVTASKLRPRDPVAWWLFSQALVGSSEQLGIVLSSLKRCITLGVRAADAQTMQRCEQWQTIVLAMNSSLRIAREHHSAGSWQLASNNWRSLLRLLPSDPSRWQTLRQIKATSPIHWEATTQLCHASRKRLAEVSVHELSDAIGTAHARCTQATELHSAHLTPFKKRLLCVAHVDHAWVMIATGSNSTARTALQSAVESGGKCEGIKALKQALEDDKIPDELYDALEIKSNASQEEVRKAYRQKARHVHPDKAYNTTRASSAQEEFYRLAEAYRILSDLQARKLYDAGKNVRSAANVGWVYSWDTRDIDEDGMAWGAIRPSGGAKGDQERSRFYVQNARCGMQIMRGTYTRECHGGGLSASPANPCDGDTRCIECVHTIGNNCTAPTTKSFGAHAEPLLLTLSPGAHGAKIRASLVYNFLGLIAVRLSCRLSKQSPTVWSRWRFTERPAVVEENDHLAYELQWDSLGHLGVVLDIAFSNNRTLLQSSARQQLLDWGGAREDRGLWPGVEWPPESAQIGKHVSRKWAEHSLKLPQQFVGHSVVALMLSCSPEHSLRENPVSANWRIAECPCGRSQRHKSVALATQLREKTMTQRIQLINIMLP